jgi:hypothetical protein
MKQAEPLLGAALTEDLENNRAAEGDRPTADDTLLRGSDAYSCSRKIAFGAMRVPKVVPYNAGTLEAFEVGKQVHVRLQGLLVKKFGAELEVACSYKAQGIEVSGHADGVYTWARSKRVAEIKSMKSYPFLKAAGGTDNFGRTVDPEGPKVEHVLQAGIYANAPQIQADTVHLVYYAKEDGRVAEWLLPMKGEPFGPDQKDIAELVDEELQRLNRIAEDIRSRRLPWRHIPSYGVVKDPPAADSKGEPWNCRYCPWQPLCARLPASKVSVDMIEMTDPAVAEEPF